MNTGAMFKRKYNWTICMSYTPQLFTEEKTVILGVPTEKT